MEEYKANEILRKLNGINLQLFADDAGTDDSGTDDSGTDDADIDDGTDGTGADDSKGDKGGKDGDDKDDRTIPYKRFKSVNKEKKVLQTENSTLKTQLADAQNLLKGKDTADEALKTENGGLKAQLLAERMRNRFITESSKQGLHFCDVDDAIRLADFSDVGVDDKGTIDREDMADMVKEFAKRKPHLLKAEANNNGGNFPGGKPPKKGDKTPEQLAKERAKSRSERKYGVPANDPWAKK